MNTPGHAGSPWSPRQRYWLQALGHAVPRLAGDGGELAAAVEVPVEAAPPAPVQRRQAPPVLREATPRRERGPVAAAMEQAAPAAVQPPPRHGGMRRPMAPDRLELAVLRASGLPPSDPRLQALLAEWPSSRLRGDAAAKRALWIRLRALRRPA